MQGRQVYPSTDLYALAASCVRLVTGKPIQELYDSYHNQWAWRKEADISASLAQILERMLYAAPKERFASAEAVLKVLQEEDDSHKPENVLNVNASEEAIFSQPADWRSLLSISKSVPNESTQDRSPSSEEQLQAVSSLENAEQQPTNPQSVESTTVQCNQTTQALTTNNYPSPEESPDQENAVQSPRKTPQFALWELLASAGFTGLEGALLLIALTSLFSIPGISFGLWGMSMGGLIYAQWKRFIEKLDFLLIGGITLAVVLLVPPLHSMPSAIVVVISLVASAGAVSVTALIRLLYKLFSQ
jgi:serine/threonine-protein kinase